MSKNRPIEAADSLAGGGEMGALVRAFDWSKTPLGPVESWSPALWTTVRLLLANRFPLLLWWGPRYVQIYNDAYRPIPGAKHPKSLGQPASECWPELWPIIGPLIDTPYRGGPATWMDDILLEFNRHGFVEETHFTIAYSPVPDDTAPGGIGGVLGTVHEITEQIIGERRVVVLRDLARSAEAKTAREACAIAAKTLAGHAKDVPFALLYLLEADGKRAFLAGATGVAIGEAISPAVVDMGPTDGKGWPLAEAIETEAPQVVSALAARFGVVPPGPWSDPPSMAVVMPVSSNRARQPAALLVAGVSARLKLDDSYRGFLELATSQVATTIANARAYEEERARAEALAELDRAKTAFFSNVSHEFRTPLTLMLGPAEELLAMKHGVLPQGAHEQMGVIHRNALRLQKLVNTLLDFSRIEAGRMQAVYERTDVGAFTAELASMFRSAIEKAHLRLIVDCPTLPEPVYVDRDMWEKIVLNLLSNAFKFTFEGEIEVRLRGVGEAVELTVRDTGVGIPAKDLPHVMERFHRVEEAKRRSHEGTGIGLALVRELTKLHGGTVAVESVEGRGTTFTVSIPTRSAHLPQDRIGVAFSASSTAVAPDVFVEEAAQWLPEDLLSRVELPASPSTNNGLRPRIVLVDDNADMREYVRRLLGTRFDVEAVENGRAALKAVAQSRPDLILTDVMMPELDGFGLLAQLRANPDFREIPVIVLSARAGEEARIEGVQAGADDYLIKPFSGRELLARVTMHLNIARERKRAAEAMGQRIAQFETLLNEAPLGVVLVDADLRIRHVNPTALPALGDTPNPIGRDLAELIRGIWPRADANEIVARFRHTLETGESFLVPEFRGERLDRGATEFYEWQINRIPLPEGGYGVVCYFREISAQVRGRAAIAESEERFRTLADNMSQLAWMTDKDGWIFWYNQRWFDFTGTTLDEMQGWGWQKVHHPDHVGRVVEKISHCFQTGESWEDLFPLRGKDGNYRWFLSRALPIRDAEGNVVRWFGTNTDVTEQRAAEEALKEADRRKDEFLATLAHELRNPLAPIGNALQILRVVGDDGPAIEQSRQMMERQLRQMVRLVDDLLDVSRITRGKVELRKERVELATVLVSALETSRPLIDAARHELSVSLPPGPLYLEADATRLAQVVSNLLNNAAKYTEAGGHIWLSAERDGESALVRVRDTGLGIPKEMLGRVFDMFTQVEHSLERAQGGLGIGLTLVKRLVEMHGGTVEARSEGPGKGSEFVVRVPLAAETGWSATRESDGNGVRATSSAGRRILVVDDNQDSAESLALMLQLGGNDVKVSYDGPHALAVARDFEPDVVLLDIGLPGMNGYEVAKRMRAEPRLQNAVLVAQTGWGQEEDRRRALAAGFDHHLVKPVDPAVLMKLLAQSPPVVGRVGNG